MRPRVNPRCATLRRAVCVGRIERHHALDEQIRCDAVAVRLGDRGRIEVAALENVAKSVIHRSTSSRRETIHRAIGS